MKLDEITHTLVLNQYHYLYSKYFYPLHEIEAFEGFMKVRMQRHFPTTNLVEIWDELEQEYFEKMDEFPQLSWENDTTSESEQADYELFELHLTP